MNKFISSLTLVVFDLVAIFLAILFAVFVRKIANIFWELPVIDYSYLMFYAVYITLIIIFGYLGIYTKRFDFWHETKLVVKACFLSFIILFSGLALGQNAAYYSRTTLILIFFFCMFLVPVVKFFTKKYLFKLGFWKKSAKVISDNKDFKNQLFEDWYLGYVRASGLERSTIFIDGQAIGKEKLNKIIENNITNSREIIFTPVLGGYDFSQSYIYNLFNSKTNIFTLENRLLSKRNKIVKTVIDYFIVMLFSCFWLPLFVLISILIKCEEPRARVLFSQKRIGLNGKEFTCYKFRSMYENQDFMEKWLEENPQEKVHYEQFHKYINDPRVTKLGKFLRKTSLDELPQLFNVLKGEMSLVGPRPYMLNEKEKIGLKEKFILSVKPGITGLWQVSGRSDVGFYHRTEIDVWYMKNWSLWNDIVILLKTLKIVLKRDGAY